MQTFLSTLGRVAAVCIGIAFLATFFTMGGWIVRGISSIASPPAAGFIKAGTRVRVHTGSAKAIENVVFQGFVPNSSSSCSPMPYEFAGMLVLQHDSGRRILLKSKNVQMIEEVGDDKPAG